MLTRRLLPMLTVAAIAGIAAILLASEILPGDNETPAAAPAVACVGRNGGLSLPPGFCATIFADNIGHARHMAAAPDGTLYVNTWSGSYYIDTEPRQGGFLVALRDTKGTGQADVTERFGPGLAQNAHGGTGIALHRGYLYAEVDDKIVRFRMAPGQILPEAKGEVILSGLPLTGEHPMHPFLIDQHDNLFVNVGSLSNACEHKLGEPQSKGFDPCTELATRGGIWRYSAIKTGQIFSPRERYATGIRNTGGMDLDAAGRLLATQHGRDRLPELFKNLYDLKTGVELPAEELLVVRSGADYGWPGCYFDGRRKKLVKAPEYGGDGKEVGDCAAKQGPVAFYPAHWAPNDLLVYDGTRFPAPYRGGVFIAFHGSWNRSPAVQQGYNIVFQPMADGKPSGPYIVFADGFAGKTNPDITTAFRPSGLALGADGALYVSDDSKGRVWRITYNGPRSAALIPAPAPVYAVTDKGDDHGVGSLPLAPGASREQVALGARIFHGEAKAGNCSGCHGLDGTGSAMGSDLASGRWLWADGTPAGIARVIRSGVPEPKEHAGAMLPLGGNELDDGDVTALAAYVWGISHRRP